MLSYFHRAAAVAGFVSVVALASASSSQAFPIAATGEGLNVIVGSTGEIFATYEGNSASYSNDLYLENTGAFLFNNHATPEGTTISLGFFSAGTLLKFRLHVNGVGDDFFTGPGSLNADGSPHARVEAFGAGSTLVSFEDLLNGPFEYNDLSFSFTNTIAAVGETPIPGALPLFATGLAGLGFFAHRRKRKQAA